MRKAFSRWKQNCVRTEKACCWAQYPESRGQAVASKWYSQRLPIFEVLNEPTAASRVFAITDSDKMEALQAASCTENVVFVGAGTPLPGEALFLGFVKSYSGMR